MCNVKLITFPLFIFLNISLINCGSVLMTEVFEIVIDQTLFNWTYDNPTQFICQPSLSGAPDLPDWINYIYSDQRNVGYLYGVPPNTPMEVTLDIIGLNRKNYKTEQRQLTITVVEKLNPAKYEVELKIDNLNVEDMFDVYRMDRLKDVFKKHLWNDSEEDLYMTYLASAIDLGARLPLNPKEGEGVVLRLGSRAPFSDELAKLQDEVRPLLKVSPCPRDFKRTSVERYFREAGFALDWCSFSLISTMQDPERPLEDLAKSSEQKLIENQWNAYSKNDVPQRSYVHEFLFTILVPMFVMTILAVLLSLILCFHHEGIQDPLSEEYFENLYHICTDYVSSKRMENTSIAEITQYATINRVTYTLRSLSNQRDFACLSPEMTGGSQSHTNSPTSTISRGIHCRPSPPPYIKPKFSAEF
ncbi:alpha-/epsilon-sarcoglycan family member [Holotrichia oblita]|uniref:Alpha-/epsilon-sarcoglycan family member n=1 Tax=Holotrichia oblita TaxID=644536 RepID=A0ACB9T5R1_HOLOL|nr:alpha-/epsilon-sarcoglycan family member [Holotrichia oblita]